MFVEMIESTNILNSENQTQKREAWAVARVSTKKQSDESLGSQSRHINNYVSSHPELELKGIHKLKESAYCIAPKELDKIIANLPKKSALIFNKVDRFSRNFNDFFICKKIVFSKDVEIHFIIEKIIWNKDSNESVELAILKYIVNAQEESKQIKERVEDINKDLRSQGRVTYNLPLGYQSFRIDDESNWRIHPEYGQLVLNIFERYATGKYSIQDIIDMAYNEGLKGRISKQKLCKQTVINLLQNKAYIGKAIFEGKEYDHIYPKLVPEDLFMKCQEVLNNKSKPSPTKDKKQVSPFTGFIVSKISEKLFTPYETKGNIYFKSPDKGVKDLKGKTFYNALMDILTKISSNKEMSDWLEYELNKNNIAEAGLATDTTNSLKKDIEETEHKIDELLINPPQHAKPEQVDRMIQKLNQYIDNLKTKLQEAEEEERSKTNIKHIAVNGNLTSVYKCHNIEIQTEIMHLLFKKIWYKDGRATFVLKEKPAEMLNQESFVSMI